MWCGDWVTVGGTGLVWGEEEVNWAGAHRQEWTGPDWTSRSGQGDRRKLRKQLLGLLAQQEVDVNIP